MIKAFALIAIFAIAAIATPIPFTSCGAGDLTPSIVDVAPWPPVKGQDVTIIASGTLAKDITEGTYELDVSYDGIPLVSKTGDLCTFSPSFKCPQTKGAVKLSYTVNVPSYAPSGSYQVTLKAKRGDSSVLFCAEVKFSMVSDKDDIVVLTEFAPQASVPFTSCATGDLTTKALNVAPWPPVRGQDVTIVASGSLAKEVTAGTFKLDVSYDGIPLISKTGDICTFSPSFKCPQAKGDVKISYTVNVPSYAPSGNYKVTLQATRPDATTLFCASVGFSMVSNSDVILINFEEEPLQSNSIMSSIPWSSCGNGEFVPSKIEADPWPIVKGQPVKIRAAGHLAKDFTEGTYEVDVAFDGISILNKKGDLCSFDPVVKCPQKAGDLDMSYSLTVPSGAPSGTYSATIKATHADSSLVFCVKVGFSMVTEESDIVYSSNIINTVNRAQTTWKAAPSTRFIDSKISEVKRLCGSKAGGPRLPVKAFPETFINAVQIPQSFDSRTEWGSKCPSLHDVRDQGNCGSCWAVAAAAAMTDRLCIGSDGQKLFHLSSQDMTSCCGFQCGMGCDGGYPAGAWSYFTGTGLVTGGPYGSNQGCYPYQIKNCSHHVSGSLPACSGDESTPTCSSSCMNGADWTADKHRGATSYQVGSDVSQIQTEIMQHGPVEATFTVYADFPTYKSGVYQYTTGDQLGGHAVKILGWGVESGTDYWLVANSWNREWGDQGFFKIRRGTDECGIESGIVAGLTQ